MSAPAVPVTMDDITPEWLTAALRAGGKAGDCTVTAIEKVTIGQGVGILGELARLTPAYSSGGSTAPKTLIAKIPTADPGGRGIAEMLGFYEKEVRFYDEVGDRIGVRTAHSYFTGRDPENVRYVILMEDLGGLQLGDQVAGASAEECLVLMHQMAKLHARWWGSPDLETLEWLPYGNAPMLKLSALAYAQSLEPAVEKFGDRMTGAQIEMAGKFLPRMNPIQDNFAAAPVTLCHGDLRLDNVFWGSPDNSSPVTLVDWQIAIKARGPYDIGYFMSQSVDPAIRAANEESLVREYHRALAANGVQDYTFDRCWDDYRIATMYCLAYPLISAGSIDVANERGAALVSKMLYRSLSAITDLKAYEVLDRFEAAPLPEPPGA